MLSGALNCVFSAVPTHPAAAESWVTGCQLIAGGFRGPQFHVLFSGCVRLTKCIPPESSSWRGKRRFIKHKRKLGELRRKAQPPQGRSVLEERALELPQVVQGALEMQWYPCWGWLSVMQLPSHPSTWKETLEQALVRKPSKVTVHQSRQMMDSGFRSVNSALSVVDRRSFTPLQELQPVHEESLLLRIEMRLC